MNGYVERRKAMKQTAAKQVVRQEKKVFIWKKEEEEENKVKLSGKYAQHCA